MSGHGISSGLTAMLHSGPIRDFLGPIVDRRMLADRTGPGQTDTRQPYRNFLDRPASFARPPGTSGSDAGLYGTSAPVVDWDDQGFQSTSMTMYLINVNLHYYLQLFFFFICLLYFLIAGLT